MRTRTRNILICALASFLTSFAATESPGCTDFRIKAADGTVIIGRTMDFEVPVLSLIRVFPRGERWSSDAPGTTGGIRWTSKYGYVAVDMGGRLVDPLDRGENLSDGLNEAGLSFGWLSMPDYTAYQDEAAAREPEKATRPPGPLPLGPGELRDGGRGQGGRRRGARLGQADGAAEADPPAPRVGPRRERAIDRPGVHQGGAEGLRQHARRPDERPDVRLARDEPAELRQPQGHVGRADQGRGLGPVAARTPAAACWASPATGRRPRASCGSRR